MITIEKEIDFKKITDAWHSLLTEDNCLSVYQSSDYMSASWKYLFLYRLLLRVSPVFYVFKENNKPIFILPLFKTIGKRRYRLYGYKAGFGYLDAAYRNDISLEKISECIDLLKQKLGDARIEFRYVRRETQLGQRNLFNGGRVSEKECISIALPQTYDDYNSSLSKHMRQNIRTSYNRMKTDGVEYVFKLYAYSEIPDGVSDELMNLYIDRQVSKYKKSTLYRMFVKYIDLGTKIHKDSSVNVVAAVLSMNGRISAFYDAIIANDNSVIIPRLAISDDFNKYSPGVLLINESIKVLIGRGVRVIDLTHGAEQYKISMGGAIHYCVELEIIT